MLTIEPPPNTVFVYSRWVSLSPLSPEKQVKYLLFKFLKLLIYI